VAPGAAGAAAWCGSVVSPRSSQQARRLSRGKTQAGAIGTDVVIEIPSGKLSLSLVVVVDGLFDDDNDARSVGLCVHISFDRTRGGLGVSLAFEPQQVRRLRTWGQRPSCTVDHQVD
jgi:hypothetical protein